jgi:hypothetical protein
MSESNSQVERLLDLFVYAPLGLLESASDEFDNLAQKGRHRVEGQVHTARLVGQFAVQTARSEATKMLNSVLGRMARGGGGETGVVHRPEGVVTSGEADNAGHPSGEAARAGNGAEQARARSQAEGGRSHRGPGATGQISGGSEPLWNSGGSASAARSSDGREAEEQLAIPGYDSLSASQVVQRLDGLSHGELDDVKRYEQAHRHRRTILNRVDQLLQVAASGEQS